MFHIEFVQKIFEFVQISISFVQKIVEKPPSFSKKIKAVARKQQPHSVEMQI